MNKEDFNFSKCYHWSPECDLPTYWFITTDSNIDGRVFGYCHSCALYIIKRDGTWENWVDALKKNGDVYLAQVKTYEDALEAYRKYIILL